MQKLQEISKRWLPPIIWFYFTLLLGWLVAYLIIGDRQGYLALINALAKYLFLPVLFIALLNLVLRRREIWGMAILALAAFLFFWGNLFVPGINNFPADAPCLRVMTYNTLGYSTDPQAAVDVIQQMGPDVVFIQEINTALAQLVQEQMADTYPYQLLNPQDDVTGMALLSKYPFEPAEKFLPERFLSVPQLVIMDWAGQEIELVNFHMWSTGISLPHVIENNFRLREAQAQAIDDLAANGSYPLIVGGDANTTSLNTAHAIMTRHLNDVWMEAGFGFGHTFPDGQVDFSFLPNTPPVWTLKWLVRIDYILVSDDWVVEAAYLAPHDGESDHRGVVADLVFLGER
ncbi:MAG: hypothetical protein DWQ07_19365 [Chloroflexi bacterium]|nr:MAG: hypothetical protein DWQ07_19365 [Chloroflexota bacterium]MBL1194242.1 hypothetical protein [Chloroflexota bacterium]NOH11535.1 hypothetical protein [Chloroflexota bacterium]